MVGTFLDAELDYLIWPTLIAARKEAAIEASDTGGLTVEIESIEIGDEEIAFFGRLPSGLLVGEAVAYGRLTVKPIATGRFHCTWASLLQPRGCVGYMVLQPPFRVQSRIAADTRDRAMAVVCQLVRNVRTLSSRTIIGARLCGLCNEPISPPRISALPGTRVCISCKQKEERNRPGHE